MIVIDLSCKNAHRFEGWFASGDAFEQQRERGLVSCPTCGETQVQRLPSAPYVRTRSLAAVGPSTPVVAAAAPAAVTPVASAQAVVELMQTLRRMARGAEDVGERLPEEARRIHYGETEARDIRGAASRDEIEELFEEGIVLLPVPPQEDELH